MGTDTSANGSLVEKSLIAKPSEDGWPFVWCVPVPSVENILVSSACDKRREVPGHGLVQSNARSGLLRIADGKPGRLDQ